jgi:hypothetical protein
VSLIAGFRALWEDDIDREDIAKRQLELWASGAERAIECRRDHDSSQFFDLYFGEFMADPIGSVKRIYSYFQQELSEEGERRLLDWQARNPQHKHGEHQYSKEEIGVSSKQILDRFAGYMDYFQMKP